MAKNTAVPREDSPTIVTKAKIISTSIIIGSIAAIIFVFLRYGPLYRFEWTYLFYGIVLFLIAINSLVFRKSKAIVRIIYTVSAYILISVIGSLGFLLLINNDRVDLREYLTNNATTILHKYKSQENYWDGGFLDPTGYVYYSNVAASDISSLTNLRRSEVLIDLDNSFRGEKEDWSPLRSSLSNYIPEKYQTLIHHPDTLCVSAGGTLCANKTTLEVVFIYLSY